jgi:hypothetical protein
VNPNHGGAFSSGDPPLIATNRVYTDSARLSYLVLPVVDPAPSSLPVLVESVAGMGKAPFRLLPGTNPASEVVGFGLVPARSSGVSVEATVFDTAGRLVRTLIPRGTALDAPRHVHWDGRDGNRRPMPAGVYLIRVRSHGYQTSLRSVLVR